MQLVGWSRLTLHGRGTSRAMAAAARRAQSMLSAATKSSHQEGALGAMAATIARWQRRKDRSANFGDQLELLG